VQIPEVIRYATTSLIWGQLIGAAIGGAAGLALSIVVRRKGKAAPAPG
jgi:gas vesicle protein